MFLWKVDDITSRKISPQFLAHSKRCTNLSSIPLPQLFPKFSLRRTTSWKASDSHVAYHWLQKSRKNKISNSILPFNILSNVLHKVLNLLGSICHCIAGVYFSLVKVSSPILKIQLPQFPTKSPDPLKETTKFLTLKMFYISKPRT